MASHTKLIGVMIDYNLKWDTNTDSMDKMASLKFWLICRINMLDMENPIIFLESHQMDTYAN